MNFEFLRHATWGGVFPMVFVTAVIGGLVVTPLVRWSCAACGLLDHPNHRSNHTTPVPLGGGLAIGMVFVLAVVVGVFQAGISEAALKVVLLGGVVTLFLGLVDDMRGVPAVLKLLALFALTLLLWWIDERLILRLTPWMPVNLFLTVIWVAGVTSAINAIDNMNGLSVGFVAIASLTYFAVAVVTLADRSAFPSTLNRFWGMVSLALCGACLGFLPYNFPRGRIFIGDCGSFFLGYNLAVLGVMGEWSDQSVARATIPLLILALPLFDLSFVVYTRHRAGVTRTLVEAIRHCARDHLSHRLVALGLTSVQAVLVLLAVAAILSLSAVSLTSWDTGASTVIHLIQSVLVLLILGVLIKVGSTRRCG